MYVVITTLPPAFAGHGRLLSWSTSADIYMGRDGSFWLQTAFQDPRERRLHHTEVSFLCGIRCLVTVRGVAMMQRGGDAAMGDVADGDETLASGRWDSQADTRLQTLLVSCVRGPQPPSVEKHEIDTLES